MSGPRRSAPHRHFRRRIITVGSLAALALFSIGFPIFNNRIESDLERRVPAELAEAGFTGITASFNGQDGTLWCAQPLGDPETATQIAYDVWGVRKITLDRLCRVNRAPTIERSEQTAADELTDDASAAAGTLTTQSTAVAGQLFDSVGDVVSSEPELSFVAVLLEEAGLMETLIDPTSEPITLFAPSDVAFDALPADVTAQLRSDGAGLAELLAHHMAPGLVRTGELAAGPLVMVDGTSTVVGTAAGGFVIDAASVTTPDLIAANGVVHVIDQVLLPPGLDIAGDEPIAPVTATLAGGIIRLTGVVKTEVERSVLLDGAGRAAGAGNVVDELTVDPDVGLTADLAADVAVLLTTLPVNLVSGTTGFDGTSLFLNGLAVSDDAAAAVTSVAETLGVEAQLEVGGDVADPVQSEAAAAAAELELQLNEFVAGNPVRFEPSSASLAADGVAVVDRLAVLAGQLTGMSMTIEGHTDSDGDATANLALSQMRAEAVREALVQRGLDGSSIDAVGFGEQHPVLVDGVEDKQASRRVEFRVRVSA